MINTLGSIIITINYMKFNRNGTSQNTEEEFICVLTPRILYDN